MTEWISVKDRIPECWDDGYLVYLENGEIAIAGDVREHKWKSGNVDYRLHDVGSFTVMCWMPLPEPPKEDNDG